MFDPYVMRIIKKMEVMKEEEEDGDITHSGEETMTVGGNWPKNEAQIIPLVESSSAESLEGKFPSNFLNSKATVTRAEPSGKSSCHAGKGCCHYWRSYCPCRKQVDSQCKRKGSLTCE